MPPEDSRAPFMRIPWTAALLKKPNIICRVPQSRISKKSGEDSLFAEILKTPRTLRSCISFFQKPDPDQPKIDEVTTLLTLGDGVNGHPDVMHGGIVATILDEAMGILQGANIDRDHISAVGQGKAEGELSESPGTYTAYMNIQYKAPVHTPGVLMATAKIIKRDGRKEWIYAEIKQREGVEEDYEGEEILCATAEALMIEPKPMRSKL